MSENQPRVRKKIALQQVLLQDSSVFSIQWMILPYSYIGKLSPITLMERYLNYIKIFTLSLIRPYQDGHKIEFRLFNSKISLISFTGPTIHFNNGSQSVSLSICGGLLVQSDNCRRGELSFVTKPIRNGLKVILQLSDFCPMLLGSSRPSRLRKVFYKITQAYIHKIVTVKFLSRLYLDLEGFSPKIVVVRIRVKNGEET